MAITSSLAKPYRKRNWNVRLTIEKLKAALDGELI
jgi:hypothetical protein